MSLHLHSSKFVVKYLCSIESRIFVSSVSSETKRIYFGFKVNSLHIGVNYLHIGVNWPIAIEFVIENVNILELKNKLVNTHWVIR